MKTVRENGSFRLIEHDGRYALVEVRGGLVFTIVGDSEGPGIPDTPANLSRIVASCDWTDEDSAHRRLDELAERGNDLAARIW